MSVKRLSVSSSVDSAMEGGAYTLMLAVAVKPAAVTSSVADDNPVASLVSATDTSHVAVLSEKERGATDGARTEQPVGIDVEVTVLDRSELDTAATLTACVLVAPSSSAALKKTGAE